MNSCPFQWRRLFTIVEMYEHCLPLQVPGARKNVRIGVGLHKDILHVENTPKIGHEKSESTGHPDFCRWNL